MTHRALLSCVVLAVVCIATGSAKQPAAPVAEKPKAAATPFHDEPAAHALYKQMIEAMRKAKSLSYVSHYELEGIKGYKGDCTYRAWLKKPNYFRVEAEATAKMKVKAEPTAKTKSADERKGGILIGDGNTLWLYWPQGRFKYGPQDDDPAVYEKTRFTSYMKKPAPPGSHSIGHRPDGWTPVWACPSSIPALSTATPTRFNRTWTA